MPANGFESYSAGFADQFVHVLDLDTLKSDTVDLTTACRGFYVTGAGAVKFTSLGGETDTWTFAATTFVPIAVKRIWSTGTTATGLKGGW